MIPEEFFKISDLGKLEDLLDLVYIQDSSLIESLNLMNFIAEVFKLKVFKDNQVIGNEYENTELVLQAKRVAKHGLKAYDSFLELIDSLIINYESLSKQDDRFTLKYEIINP